MGEPEADPCISAIAGWREARSSLRAAIAAAGDVDDQDPIYRQYVAAAITALMTEPTTLAGLRIFCRFGQEIASPPFFDADNDVVPPGSEMSVEQVFLETLNLAANKLCR